MTNLSALLLATSLLLACGGRTVDGHVHEEPAPPMDASTGPCVATLGHSPVEHACQHARLGPFVETLALNQPEQAQDMSLVHHTYHFVMAESGPPFHGFVSFRTSREGAQAFMHPTGVHLDFSQGSLPISSVDAAANDCDLFSRATVMTAVSGATYLVEVSSAERREFDVFVEHLEAFAEEAWSNRCN